MANKKTLTKYGKRLLTQALDNFYFFDDDEIENALHSALLKFKGQSKYRKLIRSNLWSNTKIRDKICNIAYVMFNKNE